MLSIYDGYGYSIKIPLHLITNSLKAFAPTSINIKQDYIQRDSEQN